MLPRVRGAWVKGMTLLDFVVVIAVLALLVYLVRLDWPRPRGDVTSTTTAQPTS